MSKKLVKGIDHTGICAVFLCHNGQGNIVMHLRSKHARDEQGTWDIGGGGLKFGEKIEDCLAREVKEEYCADIVTHQFLGYRDVHRLHEGKVTHWIALDFLVQINPSQVAIGDPHKMESIDWFTIDTMPPEENRHSQSPHFLQQYITEITEALSPVRQPQ